LNSLRKATAEEQPQAQALMRQRFYRARKSPGNRLSHPESDLSQHVRLLSLV
jgi:hypothetical protein